MSLVVGPGTIVLNQDPSDPMSGEVVGRDGDDLLVRWSSGNVFPEQASDVTLTGALVLVNVQDA